MKISRASSGQTQQLNLLGHAFGSVGELKVFNKSEVKHQDAAEDARVCFSRLTTDL